MGAAKTDCGVTAELLIRYIYLRQYTSNIFGTKDGLVNGSLCSSDSVLGHRMAAGNTITDKRR